MIYIVDLESVSTRYTGQWKEHVPALLQRQGHTVTVIDGPMDIPAATTPGAFLNFGGTNIYKSAQVEKISRLFCNGQIKPGDYFLFTDAWHPGIINLKYMSELLNIPIKIGGLWHAGSYDSADFLGRLIGNEPWVRHAEKSFFHAIDHNFFATNFHIDMFIDRLLGMDTDLGRMHYMPTNKIVRSGWPMEYLSETLLPFKNMPKRDLIVFPHRIAPEKQVEIFRDLANEMPEYEFVVCQDQSLTKDEYHTLLGQAKMVFSANLQETLGISCFEGALVDAIPFVPDRLSYREMYLDEFKYPGEWTEDWNSYRQNRSQLIDRMRNQLRRYDDLAPLVEQNADTLRQDFFSADGICQVVR
jgi:hypothetical protein